MSKVTKESLKNWDDEDSCINDDIHEYFDSTELVDWIDIYREGISVFNYMFDDKVEIESPLGSVFAGVAAQSANAVFKVIADTLGVNASTLKYAVAARYDLGEKHESISCEDFMSDIQAVQVSMDEFKSDENKELLEE